MAELSKEEKLMLNLFKTMIIATLTKHEQCQVEDDYLEIVPIKLILHMRNSDSKKCNQN